MTFADVVTYLALMAGGGLAVGGVYELAGPGWALLVGALPCFGAAWLIQRGLD